MTDKWPRVTAPAVHLTGWYDIFTEHQLRAFRGYRWGGSNVHPEWNYLVVLPTGHCAGGAVPWPGAADGWTYANEISDTMFRAFGSNAVLAEEAKDRLRATPQVIW